MNSFSFIEVRKEIVLLILPVLLVLITACTGNSRNSGGSGDINLTQDSLINYNKKVIRTEDEDIEDYISRHQWKMIKTSTGLRYMIYSNGNGIRASKGKAATILYSVRLLNGDLAYSLRSGGAAGIQNRSWRGGERVGRGNFIIAGDRAKFIVPSHLAFGLLGDQDKIPRNATLVYDIDLIQLK